MCILGGWKVKRREREEEEERGRLFSFSSNLTLPDTSTHYFSDARGTKDDLF